VCLTTKGSPAQGIGSQSSPMLFHPRPRHLVLLTPSPKRLVPEYDDERNALIAGQFVGTAWAFERSLAFFQLFKADEYWDSDQESPKDDGS
jgi:hypothetical protein